MITRIIHLKNMRCIILVFIFLLTIGCVQRDKEAMTKPDEDCIETPLVKSSTSEAGLSDTLKSKEGTLSEKQDLHLVPNHTELPPRDKNKSKKPCDKSSKKQ